MEKRGENISGNLIDDHWEKITGIGAMIGIIFLLIVFNSVESKPGITLTENILFNGFLPILSGAIMGATLTMLALRIIDFLFSDVSMLSQVKRT